jgi:hypothetical protein
MTTRKSNTEPLSPGLPDPVGSKAKTTVAVEQVVVEAVTIKAEKTPPRRRRAAGAP